MRSQHSALNLGHNQGDVQMKRSLIHTALAISLLLLPPALHTRTWYVTADSTPLPSPAGVKNL
jgi:hypothetical protein